MYNGKNNLWQVRKIGNITDNTSLQFIMIKLESQNKSTCILFVNMSKS